MKIEASIIAHNDQRYETAGDWLMRDDGTICIFISDTGNRHSNALVMVHEIVEAILCQDAGIPVDLVDKFDIAFEARREDGNMDEPGNDPSAPYYEQHQWADMIERIMAKALGIKWCDHDAAVNGLGRTIDEISNGL